MPLAPFRHTDLSADKSDHRPTNRTDTSGRQIGANKYMLSHDAVHTHTHRHKSRTDKLARISISIHADMSAAEFLLFVALSKSRRRTIVVSRAHSVLSPVVVIANVCLLIKFSPFHENPAPAPRRPCFRLHNIWPMLT